MPESGVQGYGALSKIPVRCQFSRETPYLLGKPRQVEVCPAKRESLSESCVQTAASLLCPFSPMWHTLTLEGCIL